MTIPVRGLAALSWFMASIIGSVGLALGHDIAAMLWLILGALWMLIYVLTWLVHKDGDGA